MTIRHSVCSKRNNFEVRRTSILPKFQERLDWRASVGATGEMLHNVQRTAALLC